MSQLRQQDAATASAAPVPANSETADENDGHGQRLRLAADLEERTLHKKLHGGGRMSSYFALLHRFRFSDPGAAFLQSINFLVQCPGVLPPDATALDHRISAPRPRAST